MPAQRARSAQRMILCRCLIIYMLRCRRDIMLDTFADARHARRARDAAMLFGRLRYVVTRDVDADYA